ncbi:uncharacterized protein [Eurosta solidaginis]|uniref:uncharacterized protein n=1 Tax=Eurosta solidaginis TaxID=178769 RepID=UPI00353147B7
MVISYTWNLANQCFILAVTICMSVKCAELKFQKKATHGFLCTLGFVFLSAEGMMVHCNNNWLTRSLHPDTKTTLYFYLQLMGGLLGVAGTLQKIPKKHHFLSWRGKLGLAACVFFVINCLSGILSLYSCSYRQLVSPVVNDFIHNFLGLLTFFTAKLAQYTGYNTGFFRRNLKKHDKFYKYLTATTLVITIWEPFRIFMAKLF